MPSLQINKVTSCLRSLWSYSAQSLQQLRTVKGVRKKLGNEISINFDIPITPLSIIIRYLEIKSGQH